MTRAVVQRDLAVDDRIAGDHAVLHLFLDAFVDGRNIFARHHAADDLVDELVTGTGLHRFDTQENVGVLAAAAGLPDELAFLLDRGTNRFTVGDLRLADIGQDVELPAHPIDDDIEVQLAHSGDDRLPRLLIGVHAERRIFLGQLPERNTHLLLIGLGFRLDCDGNNRLGETPYAPA